MKNAKKLLAQIAADVALERIQPADLAKRAGVKLTSLISMIDPAWTNRAVENLEAIEKAYRRMPKKRAKPKAR